MNVNRYLLFALLVLATNSHGQTVKKVMLEEFVASTMGVSPAGTLVYEQILASNPGVFIPVRSHISDNLQVPEGYAIFNDLGVGGFPYALIDRNKFSGTASAAVTYSKWDSLFKKRKALTPNVSISFSGVKQMSATTYNADVNVKFLTVAASGLPIKLNVYILEDSIPAVGALEQQNWSSSIQGGATPLTNWFHNATLRKALGGNWGFSTTVPVNPVVGTTYTENVSFTIPVNYVAKNINVFAFVSYDGDTLSNQKEILNVEQYPLKFWYPNSVNNMEESFNEVNVYPNPARLQDLIKISFQLKEDAAIHMEVLNSIGQVVSKPYTSFEIKGAHTIQWSARENRNLVGGIYFVKLYTDKDGQMIRKLVIE